MISCSQLPFLSRSLIFAILYDMDCSPFQNQPGNQSQLLHADSLNSLVNSKASLGAALAPNPDFLAGINPWLWLQCPVWESATPWCQPIPLQGLSRAGTGEQPLPWASPAAKPLLRELGS